MSAARLRPVWLAAVLLVVALPSAGGLVGIAGRNRFEDLSRVSGVDARMCGFVESTLGSTVAGCSVFLGVSCTTLGGSPSASMSESLS